MTRLTVREYKSHFGSRWSEFKHNRKNSDKILLLENKFILSNLLLGSTLAINCLGETYKDIIDISLVFDTNKKYRNLLLINNIEFKYKTIQEFANIIVNYAQVADRLIVNFNSSFIIYNRLSQTPVNLLSSIEELLLESNLATVKKLVTRHIKNTGFGNMFIILEKLNA